MGRRPVTGKFHIGQDFCCGHIEPAIAAEFCDFHRDRSRYITIEVGFFILIVKSGDRDSPSALSADAPIGSGFDCSPNPGFAPCGYPTVILLDRFDLGKGLSAVPSLVKRDEPLVDCTEYDGGLGSPAVGITMGIFGLRQQGSGRSKQFKDPEIGWCGSFCGEVFNRLQGRQAN